MPFGRRLRFAMLLSAAVVAIGAAEPAARESAFPPIPGDELHNAHRVTEKVLSGAAPEGEAAFRTLRDLGVRTIISVDGAKPDVQMARKYGMRYVHLPIGYDDVAPEEGRNIAKAIDELPGPIYLHCHHGRHRSAAALAVACVMNGSLKPEQAESVLTTFGTGENYKGLWASARGARPMDKRALAEVKVNYVERAPIPLMADAMVKVDGAWERLRLAQKSGWAQPPAHPDVDPAHEALQLTEHYHELGRTDDVRAARPQGFRDALARSEREAAALHAALKSFAAAVSPRAAADADAAFKTVGTSCTACHKAYRD